MKQGRFRPIMQTETTPAQADVSELDLIRRCQAGDTEAFDELVTRYRTRVFGMIYNMIHSEQDAWDLAQDSFVKAWKKKIKAGGAEFDDTIQLKEIDPASKTVPKADALPYETMERSEIRARIDRAIAQLSPEHRAVILMKEIEEMQYHEIAETLGCSIGTVMSRLFYARKKLQTLLKDVYENI